MDSEDKEIKKVVFATGNADKRRRNVKGVYAVLPEADLGGKTGD